MLRKRFYTILCGKNPLFRNFPEILRDPEFFHIKSRDYKLPVGEVSNLDPGGATESGLKNPSHKKVGAGGTNLLYRNLPEKIGIKFLKI